MKAFQNQRGAVSIFLVLILVPMLTVSALFVDASKLSLARSVSASATDLALNTALTNYDTKLKDMYGLFATAQDMDDLFGRLEDYYRTCITSSGVDEEDAESYTQKIMAQLGLVADSGNVADLLNMELMDFSVEKYKDANLANPTILKKQIIDFMKYRAPINTGMKFVAALESFTTLGKQTKMIEGRTNYYKEQQTAMEYAQAAWSEINAYNRSEFITNASFFSLLKTAFDGYQVQYEGTADAQRTDGFAGKTIRDLYGNENRDMRGYVTYNYYAESVEEDVGNGVKEMIPRFYTNSDKTSWDLAYIDMTTYSEDEPANADDIRRTLKNYYDAEAAYVQAESNLLPIDFDNLGAVYGLQYLMQTDRGKYYSAWTSAMRTLYQRYSEMRHAVAFKGQDGFMTYTADFDGDGVETSYGDYYNQFCVNYETHSGIFDTNVTKMTPTLKNFANAVGNTQTSTTDTNNKIVANYEQISKYRKAIADAVPHLVNAVEQLGKLYDCVKPGGTLEQKADAWQKTTEDSDVKDTSMAKQDQAEIKDASSYLDADEVQKLIDRINNVIPHLQDMLTQIDSYKFFGTYIGEISDYNSLKNLLKSSIGDYELLHVPTTTAELNAKVSGWVSGKFVIGKPVDITWNKGDSAADLTISNKPKFYDYLHSKFNAAGTGDTDTTEKKEDQENGENLYNKVKSSFSSNASGSKDEAKKGNISNSHEISGLSNLPSSGSNYTTKSMDLTPDENSASSASGISSLFSQGLLNAIADLATDLRDNLYVSDYILSMFSYDTLVKEYEKNHDGEEAGEEDIKTLTLNPINAKYNYAYGKEVEYVIYGGKNADNLAKAYGTIFAIRFVFNVIYAFMSSEVRSEALAIATPISAATLGIIPVPLIQAILIIGIACCESGIDLVELRDGEKVPLFKSKDTWRTSISGMVTLAKEETAEFLKETGKKVIDAGTEKLTELLDMADEELTKFINDNTEEFENRVGGAFDDLITRHVEVAMQKVSTLVENALNENLMDDSGTDIVTATVNDTLDGLDEWLAQEGPNQSEIVYQIEQQVVQLLRENSGAALRPYVQAVQDVRNGITGSIEEASNKILDQLNSIKGKITGKISEVGGIVEQYKGEMVSKVKESAKEGAGKLKDTLNEQLDSIFDNASADPSVGSTGGEGGDGSGLSSLIAFAYSDYLRLFLIIGLFANQESVLKRTADVIQVNMAMQPPVSDPSSATLSDYVLSKSSVYVQVTSTIQVKPTMLALPLFADVENNPASDSGWYTFTSSDIRGY